MTTYLDKIIAAHRSKIDVRDADLLFEEAKNITLIGNFKEAVGKPSEMAIIAEFKKRSPSRGDILLAADIDEVVLAYEAGGAECISILTDQEFFGGSLEDLKKARRISSIPILRKDFTVRIQDIYDAKIAGANAILLIVAALNDSEINKFIEVADSVDLECLVEVHDELELKRALDNGARVVGVNQRDLHTFEVNRERAVEIAPSIPDGILKIAESGITGVDDVLRLKEAGYDAVLIGEYLMRSPDKVKAIRDLLHSG